MSRRLLWLGRPLVEQDGPPVRFEMRKALAVLAYLSLERRRHTRLSLAHLFWPGHDQAHALGNLRRTLSSLNSCLGPGWADSNRETLQLHPAWPCWLDVDVFQDCVAAARTHRALHDSVCAFCREKLEEAVALYRGDFLEGFALPACPDFDRWQLFHRDSLRRDLAHALDMLAELGEKPQPATIALCRLVAQGHPAELSSVPRAPLPAFAPRANTRLTGTPVHPDYPSRPPLLNQLIRTKLRPPFIRSELVLRPRLLEKIAQGLRGPLTLVAAPAGFGKTTLLASAIATWQRPVAWLSLDTPDNQPERFLHYLIAALQEADRALGTSAARLLAPTLQAPAETILTNLINDLDRADTDVVLVLDDYHFVTNQAVHEAVAFLVEHCPRTLHLVLASRSDPPLPLARLRARGQIVELRPADLSFDESEASQFLNKIMQLHLDPEAVMTLAERTEGWIAGLQMAALALQGPLQGTTPPRDRQDVCAFVERFSGTTRYILDYLLEEVLSVQPPEVQHFLLYTSILERMSAPLCDALLTNDLSSQRNADEITHSLSSLVAGKSASLLHYLERANLFLVSLDDQHTWYRYHHLFADLLRAQLHKSLGAPGVAQLHVRAAEWHRQAGSILEAIHHASLAGDDERLERFIEQSYVELVSRGEQSWLRSWTGNLSKERVYRRPWLCIYTAYGHSWFGELDEAERLLKEAEKRVPLQVPASEAPALQGLLAYVKSRVAGLRGDMRRAIELCLEARSLIGDSQVPLQLDTSITLGYEYFMSGDYAHASPILNETIQLGITTGAVINTVAASCVMARLLALQGRLHQSYGTYQTASQLIPATGGKHLGARALVEIGLAELLYEWNDLDTALLHIDRGLDMLPWWGKADDFALAYITLANIQLARANQDDAAEAVDKARQVIRKSAVFSEARNALEMVQVKLWLQQGDLPAANRWLVSQEDRWRSQPPFRFEDELSQIARIRIWLAQDRHDQAIDLLPRLAETARSAGRIGRVLEMRLLEALASWKSGNMRHALAALTECLTLAHPEAYARLFLDEGLPLQMLLARWLAQAGSGPLRGYALDLFSQFDAEPALAKAAQPEVIATSILVEPVSQRELEVLRLLALGRSNQQIAEELVIAVGTVKAHTATIYRKLDVANRTEAVARARQLCLLD